MIGDCFSKSSSKNVFIEFVLNSILFSLVVVLSSSFVVLSSSLVVLSSSLSDPLLSIQLLSELLLLESSSSLFSISVFSLSVSSFFESSLSELPCFGSSGSGSSLCLHFDDDCPSLILVLPISAKFI